MKMFLRTKRSELADLTGTVKNGIEAFEATRFSARSLYERVVPARTGPDTTPLSATVHNMLICDHCQSLFDETTPSARAAGMVMGKSCPDCGDGTLRVSDPPDDRPLVPELTTPSCPIRLEVCVAGPNQAVQPGQAVVVTARVSTSVRGIPVPAGCRISLAAGDSSLFPVQQRPINPAHPIVPFSFQLPMEGTHLLQLFVDLPDHHTRYHGLIHMNCGTREAPQPITFNFQQQIGTGSEYVVVTNAEAQHVHFPQIPEPAAHPLLASGEFHEVELAEVYGEIRLIGTPPHAGEVFSQMTLSVADPVRDRYVNLIGGRELLIGRHPERSRPRMFLRTSAAFDPEENYREIHRTHGVLRLTERGVEWQNGQGTDGFHGTVIDGRLYQQENQRIGLSHSTRIIPAGRIGGESERFNDSLPQIRIIPGQSGSPLRYIRLASEFGLQPPLPTVGPCATVRVERVDELNGYEAFVLLQNVAVLGCSASADIVIQGPLIHPFHADIVWFHNAFWIEPRTVDCPVRVNGVRLEPCQVAMLRPRTTLTLGETLISVTDLRSHSQPMT